MIKVIIVILLVLVVAIVSIYAYFGGFTKVQFKVEEQGGEILVYQDMVGDYKQSGVVMNQIYQTLQKEYKIETYKGFGIYYDNPQEVEKTKLRSEIGCVLEEKDHSKINNLKDKYKIKVFPKQKYVITEFPHKGTLSIIIGIMKVYPALTKYVKEHNYNTKGFVMELYDIPGKKTVYRKEM